MALDQVDPIFLEQAVSFLDDGFRKDGVGVLVTTPATCSAIVTRLAKWLKPDPSRLAFIDATKALRDLTAEGVPDDFDFYKLFDEPITRMQKRPGAKLVRVVNELPALAGRITNRASRTIVTELSQELEGRYGTVCEFMLDFAETVRVVR